MEEALRNYNTAKKNLYKKIEEKYLNHPSISEPILLTPSTIDKLRTDFGSYIENG
ncbi:MAG TPA: hypothetical protein VF411_13215 [Bacteroidia bacterium]